MDSPMKDAGDIVPADVADTAFQLRSYQAEMVEASVKANVIVVMDTGSGKTHIAIERARAELETCQTDKLVWFLAPTVTLCEQQYEVFQSNLPGFGYQILCGRDDIELWNKSDWEIILCNIRIVFSTHQVLLDALTHGFVRMSKLALLIFDEAHHCTLKHPAHRIMSDFYVQQIENGDNEVPKVLGLSASPVMKADATVEGLQKIEQNLFATVKTPKLHRTELVRYSHRPELLQVNYPSESPSYESSSLLIALRNAVTHYNLMTDPYVISLIEQQKSGYDTSRQLDKLWKGHKTYCYDQLKILYSKAKAMAEELGTSPMEYYVRQCIAQFESISLVFDQQLVDLSTDERQHLLKILRGLPLWNLAPQPSGVLDSLSRKVDILVDTLVAEVSSNPDFTGLVFVEQRVWVAVLAEILTLDPRTRDLLRIGTFVGTSNISKRKANIATFAEPKNQQNTLDDFRAGGLNLILATSVLEEGIDVSNCHLVVCFERPKNLKSFVQRRGRARKQQSRYYIFNPDTGAGKSSQAWQSLEAEMRKAYEDNMRQVKLAEENEQIEEDGERYFKVQSTGALLTLDNASSHLHHFCSRLVSSGHADTKPQFDFTETRGRITAKVMLPLSVDPLVRSATSLESWRTEKMAQKDAAFEAYKALYIAGLVNDNLLPVREKDDEEAAQFQTSDNRPAFLQVSQTLDPWPPIAKYHRDNPHVWYRIKLEVKGSGGESMCMVLLTPAVMPAIPEVLLHWNETTKFTVETSWLPGTSLVKDEVQLLRSITWKMLRSVFGVYIEEGTKDFLCLLAPCEQSGGMMDTTQLRDWHMATEGQLPAPALLALGHGDLGSWGLITLKPELRRFMLKAIQPSQSQGSLSVEETVIDAIRLPKRRDFLNPIPADAAKNDAYTRTENLLASVCAVDNLPASYSMLALLFPSILSRLEVYLVADILRTTILNPVAFDVQHLPIIVTALTPTGTEEGNNYQRLEFLGDCILKFIASLHLMAANLRRSEGWLTGKKGRLVSNGYLARATLAAGLDSFIFYKKFTGAKWKPKYIGQVLADTTPPAKQAKGSKLMADIIESLIGASYLVGGFPKAFACMQTVLPLEIWTPIPDASTILHDAVSTLDTVTNLHLVEELIGHTFTKKSVLLEALTHQTYNGINAHSVSSYERLEFFGDAVLEYLISRRLYAHKPELPHPTMHGIRTAMINASFLTYRMFETTVAEELTNKTTLKPEVHRRALWQFLRSSSYELNADRDKAHKQHIDVREVIAHALEHDTRFPWHALSLTDPPKFLSDIVESVLGALYIDTHGSIPACEAFVQRLGILPALEHILANNIDCFHPKERLNVIARDKKCKYIRVASNGDVDDWGMDGGGKVYRVQVQIGGERVGGQVEGVKKLQAETIAAWKAIGLIEGGKDGDVGMVGCGSGVEGIRGNQEMALNRDGEEANGDRKHPQGAKDVVMHGGGDGREDEDKFFDAEDGGGDMMED